ncbi:MAG TPA: hypothetical protein VJ998_08040 [Pseudomonadales bacterium]|nr:hypothetical protein [Pseudomonadales bacterium]
MMTANILFVTDPLCSWCWGTLPEVESTRATLEGEAEFDLIMAGLQVGGAQGLAEFNKQQLQALWQEVGSVTGQTLSGKIPENFIYHSEIACRAVEIARKQCGGPPWKFFHALQAAFYLKGQDICDAAVLAPLLGLSQVETAGLLRSAEYVDAARANILRAKDLSAIALPSIYLNDRLVCGGYVTADQLVSDLRHRLQHNVH